MSNSSYLLGFSLAKTKHLQKQLEAAERERDTDRECCDILRGMDDQRARHMKWEIDRRHEAEDESKRLIKDYDECLAEKSEIVRQMDVVMHGEEGAAKGPAHIDVLKSVEKMAQENVRLREALEYYAEIGPDESDNANGARARNALGWGRPG